MVLGDSVDALKQLEREWHTFSEIQSTKYTQYLTLEPPMQVPFDPKGFSSILLNQRVDISWHRWNKQLKYHRNRGRDGWCLCACHVCLLFLHIFTNIRD